MFVSRSLDYAIRSLIHLATAGDGSPVSLRQIAATGYVPRSYLAKLMRNLVRGGLVMSDSGVHGGYRLSKDPDEISLREIYEIVEGDFRTVVCDDDTGSCELIESCSQLPVWKTLEDEIAEILDRWRLAHFVAAEPGSEGARFVPIEHVAN